MQSLGSKCMFIFATPELTSSGECCIKKYISCSIMEVIFRDKDFITVHERTDRTDL